MVTAPLYRPKGDGALHPETATSPAVTTWSEKYVRRRGCSFCENAAHIRMSASAQAFRKLWARTTCVAAPEHRLTLQVVTWKIDGQP